MVKISLSWPEKLKSRKTFSACHNPVYVAGNEFGGATTGRNDRAT